MNKLKTYWTLGLVNLIWVIVYRLSLKSGFIAKKTKIGKAVKAPFFVNTHPGVDEFLDSLNLKIFGWIEYSKESPPCWQQSIVSKKIVEDKVQALHWSKISDFDLDIGDIKSIWDLSRFDWLLYFTVEFLKTGEQSNLDSLNFWLEDWSGYNPVNQGINWKCGQETSIRVMHLCLTSYLLKQHTQLTPAVIKLLQQHLSRIAPTILYAMAQDNNHGTSEAVALYIGGLLLEKNNGHVQASKWKNQGRHWLENRIERLIAKDGSFSQHSTNYHRVMLDSISLAEFFRLKLSDTPFSKQLLTKMQLATDWLNVFTDSYTGAVPNLGANDGAQLIPLTHCDYRDYRPSVQLASVLFYNKKCYSNEGAFNQHLKLLSLDGSEILPTKKSCKDFESGGYLFIKKNNVRLFLRYPIFRFRPSQCDVLHIDFWLNGKNIFRDAGSFSYNTEQRWLNYFSGTESHNTIQFDGQEQMPRLSRFLFGDWLKVDNRSGFFEKNNCTCYRVGYLSDYIVHNREVHLSDKELRVIDEVSGFKKKMVLRWRLIPGNWLVNNQIVTNGNISILIHSESSVHSMRIVEGWESRYYSNKQALPVLEVIVLSAGIITTNVSW